MKMGTLNLIAIFILALTSCPTIGGNFNWLHCHLMLTTKSLAVNPQGLLLFGDHRTKGPSGPLVMGTKINLTHLNFNEGPFNKCFNIYQHLYNSSDDSKMTFNYSTQSIQLTNSTLNFVQFKENYFDMKKYLNCPSKDSVELDYFLARTSTLHIECSSTDPIEFYFQRSPLTSKTQRSIPLRLTFGKHLNSTGFIQMYTLSIEGRNRGFLKFYDLEGHLKIATKNCSNLPSLAVNLTLRVKDSTAVVNLNRRRGQPELRIFFLYGHIAGCAVPDFERQLNVANIGGNNPTETLAVYSTCMDKIQNCEGVKIGRYSPNNTFIKEVEAFYQNGLLLCNNGRTNKTLHYFTGFQLEGLTEIEYNESMLEDNQVIILKPNNHRRSFYRESLKFPLISTLTVDEYDLVDFECTFVSYILIPPILWVTTYQNGSESIFVDDGPLIDEFAVSRTISKSEMKFKTSYFILNVTARISKVSCRAYQFDSEKFRQSSIVLDAKESERPIWKKSPAGGNSKLLKMQVGQDFNLTCRLDKGRPKVEFSWLKDGQEIKDNGVGIKKINTTEVSVLEFCNAVELHSGIYKCVAKNFLGQDGQEFRIKISYKNKDWIYITSVCVLALIVGIVLTIAWRVYKKQKARLTKLELELFWKGNKAKLKRDALMNEVAQHLSYNEKFEVPWSDFVCENENLGRGAFGIILGGKLREVPVAAKTIRPDAGKAMLLALLSELKIMMYLDKHEHVVQLVGSCTQFLKEGRPYMFLEYCDLGSLEMFIRQHRDTFVKPQNSYFVNRLTSNSFNYVELEASLPSDNRKGPGIKMHFDDLLLWSYQIAKGMNFLESKKVIHADLATRNILLKTIHQVKITDFGLSRQLENSSAYQKRTKTVLPWRSMALESLRDRIFTHKSDVWSYGVTVWEIFSLGKIPFAGLTWTLDFVDSLEQGLRLSKPKYSTDQIYNVLLHCWMENPDKRPTFNILERILQQKVEDSIGLC